MKGLGAYLYEALKRPLYITSLGVDLTEAAKLIENLGGSYRIPDILKKVDKLTRSPDTKS